MRKRSAKLTTAIPAFIALTTFLGACGPASPENIAEGLIEKGLESEGLENVEIDINDDDGEFSLNLTDDDGNTVSLETGQQLPEGWPTDQLLPDDAIIISAHRISNNGLLTFTAVFDGPIDQYDAFKEHFLANNASKNMTSDFETASSDGESAVYSWGTSSDVEVSILLSVSSEGMGGSITIFGQ